MLHSSFGLRHWFIDRLDVSTTNRSSIDVFWGWLSDVEHTDNTWWHAQTNTSDDEDQPKVGLAETEPVKGNSGRPTLANRRLIK